MNNEIETRRLRKRRNVRKKRRRSDVKMHVRRLKSNAAGCWREGRGVVRRINQTIRRKRVEALLVPYEFAQQAQKNQHLMQDFLSDRFWAGEGQHRPKGKDILQRSIEYHFGCKHKKGALYDRCWTYARAVRKFFDEGVDSEQLHDRIIAAGGFERLCRQCAKKQLADHESGTTSVTAIDTTRLNTDDGDEGNDVRASGGGGEVPSGTGASPKPSTHTKNEATSPRSFKKAVDIRNTLIVEEAEQGIEDLGRFLECETVKIEAYIEAQTDGWVRLIFFRASYQ